jgi:hypothetical protein
MMRSNRQISDWILAMKYLLFSILASLALSVAACRDVPIDQTGVVVPIDSTKRQDTTKKHDDSSDHHGAGAHEPHDPVGILTLYYKAGTNPKTLSLDIMNDIAGSFRIDRKSDGSPEALRDLRLTTRIPENSLPFNAYRLTTIDYIVLNIPYARMGPLPQPPVDLNMNPLYHPSDPGLAFIHNSDDPNPFAWTTGDSWAGDKSSGHFQVLQVDREHNTMRDSIWGTFYPPKGPGVDTITVTMSLWFKYK